MDHPVCNKNVAFIIWRLCNFQVPVQFNTAQLHIIRLRVHQLTQHKWRCPTSVLKLLSVICRAILVAHITTHHALRCVRQHVAAAAASVDAVAAQHHRCRCCRLLTTSSCSATQLRQAATSFLRHSAAVASEGGDDICAHASSVFAEILHKFHTTRNCVYRCISWP